MPGRRHTLYGHGLTQGWVSKVVRAAGYRQKEMRPWATINFI